MTFVLPLVLAIPWPHCRPPCPPARRRLRPCSRATISPPSSTPTWWRPARSSAVSLRVAPDGCQQAKLPLRESCVAQAGPPALIEDRVVVTSPARLQQDPRDELNCVVDNVAVQNKISTEQLRELTQGRGPDYRTFREGLCDQMPSSARATTKASRRIKVSDADIDAWLRPSARAWPSPASIWRKCWSACLRREAETVVAERCACAEKAQPASPLGRLAAVAKVVRRRQQGPGRDHLRPSAARSDVFIEAVKGPQARRVHAQLLHRRGFWHPQRGHRAPGNPPLTRSVQTHALHPAASPRSDYRDRRTPPG